MVANILILKVELSDSISLARNSDILAFEG